MYSNIHLELEDRPPDEESFIDVSNVTVGAMNTTLNRKPRIGMPDYYVDSWNSMYFLTPKGIDQVWFRVRTNQL